MGISLTSIQNSVTAGKTYKLTKVEDYIKVGSTRLGTVTQTVGGKTYTIRYRSLSNDGFISDASKEQLTNYLANYVVKEVSEKGNSVDTTQFRVQANNNVFVVGTLQLGQDLYDFAWGILTSNKTRKFGTFHTEGDLSSGTATSRGDNVACAVYGYTDEAGLWLHVDFHSLRSVGFGNTVTYFNMNDIGTIVYDEFSDDYGDYSGTGGYGGGSFDSSSDAFGLPSLPSLGVSEVGFINVYNPTRGQLAGLADELFPDFEKPEPSTAEGLEAVAENLANTFDVLGKFAESYINSGLINYVIDCHIVPVAPKTNTNSGIKIGFKTFDYSPAKVTSDYVEFDCGTLYIKEYYQNFLDYEGTRAKLYLPFIGFVDIKPEWFQSGSLGVTYHFNIIDGSCIAFVIATSSKSSLRNTVVATFGGNCCVHMPITGVNYSSMISGVVGSTGKIATSVATGSVGGVAEGVTSLLSSKPSLEQSNGYNAGMSFMCYRRPYLLIERPVASFSKNYPHEVGLPLNVTKKLGSLSGFTKASNANLSGILCNSEEKDMIQSALAYGIIL